ncbi:UNVERIFIED_CONTAM: hypothetical protein H355_013984, partial [Colinus virginianus]
HGIVFVRNDAKVFRFCRSKCHKHFKAKHNPRKFKWTKAYRKANGRRLLILIIRASIPYSSFREGVALVRLSLRFFAGKELAVDTTFEFEQRRNRPVRYDRDLFVKTVQAIRRVDEIKAARKERFYMHRMLQAA